MPKSTYFAGCVPLHIEGGAVRRRRPEGVTVFHLNIRNGIGLVEDEEGRDLFDLEAARLDAIEGIRSIISEEAKSGLVDLTGQIEICDDAGNLLCLVRYADAFDLRLGRRKR